MFVCGQNIYVILVKIERVYITAKAIVYYRIVVFCAERKRRDTLIYMCKINR